MQLQSQVDGFTSFYKNSHKGHVLNWDHSLGNATVKARFKAGQKELSVSLHQAVVLLLFNDTDNLPFQSIKDQTSMGTLPSHIFDPLPPLFINTWQMTQNYGERCKVWLAVTKRF